MAALHKPVRREIELDFIRGIAILAVVDFHSAKPILFFPFKFLGYRNHFGSAGVGVFFVLSGFLVGGLLVKEWQTRSRIDGPRFLIRRAFKIWPQYYVFLFAMVLSGKRTFRGLWGNFLNIQNYVGGIAHTWSLAVEEHAYLILILLLTFAARRGISLRHIFFFLAAAVVVIGVGRDLLIHFGYNVFFYTHTRIDGIFLGLMLAILFHARPALFQRIQGWTPLWLAGVGLALLDYRFPGVYPPAYFHTTNLLGISLLMLLYRHNPDRRRSWLYRLTAWIGLYSYGIYLWHAPVLGTIEHVAVHLPRPLAEFWLRVAPIAGSVLLGWGTTKLIEFPALRARDRLYPRRVDSAVGIPGEIEASIEHGETVPVSAANPAG